MVSLISNRKDRGSATGNLAQQKESDGVSNEGVGGPRS